MNSFVWIAIAIGAYFLFTRWQRKRAARNILNTQKGIYSQVHEYRQCQPGDFPYLDIAWYDQQGQWLEQEGFTCLGDWENVTLSRILPKMHTFIRSYSGDRGQIIAGLYHFKNRSLNRWLLALFKFPSESRILDAETEFTDGTFLVSSNTLEMDRTGPVAGIRRFQLSRFVPLQEVLASHRRQLQIVLGLDTDLKVRAIRTPEDMQGMQERMQILKNRHKQSIGYMNEDEMRRIGGDNLSTAAEITIKEINALKQKSETMDDERRGASRHDA